MDARAAPSVEVSLRWSPKGKDGAGHDRLLVSAAIILALAELAAAGLEVDALLRVVVLLDPQPLGLGAITWRVEIVHDRVVGLLVHAVDVTEQPKVGREHAVQLVVVVEQRLAVLILLA